MAATKFNSDYMAQWGKPIHTFYNYKPTQYKATREEWAVRRFIWDFKDGKHSREVAQMMADYLLSRFGSFCDTLTFACIPASNPVSNEMRYAEFCEEVCRLTGARNGYKAIHVKGEKMAIHEHKNGKHITSTYVVEFDEDFFNGQRVVLFDDIITRGFSYAKFACKLESLGAEVLGGLFLGKTTNNN